MLSALRTGLTGRVRVPAPADWPKIEKQLRASKNAEVVFSVDSLGVLFGDGAALDDLRKMAGNGELESVTREEAIKALASAKDAATVPILFNLLNDRAVADAAIRALANFDHPDTANQILQRFRRIERWKPRTGLDTLASREAYALTLVQAIDQATWMHAS